MPQVAPQDVPTLGFVTVIHEAELGYIGGYLLLNAQARPLEFHCTSPVQPNRSQEILYGATLKPYLFGEQIARTLAQRSDHAPSLFVTDQDEILETRIADDVPVLWVDASASQSGDQATSPGAACEIRNAPHLCGNKLTIQRQSFLLGNQPVAVSTRFPQDQELAKEFWQRHGDGLDLREPFDRIREALAEAQRATSC